MQALRHARGFMRSHLARRLNMRECPTLDFALDESIEKTFTMTTLLDKLAVERSERPEQPERDEDDAEG